MARWRANLESEGKSPLLRYYRVCKAAAENRRKIQKAVQDVEGDEYQPAEGKRAADSDSDDASDSEGSTSEAKSAGAAHAKLAAKPAKKRARGGTTGAADEEEADDVVEEFAMSDFEFSEDE